MNDQRGAMGAPGSPGLGITRGFYRAPDDGTGAQGAEGTNGSTPAMTEARLTELLKDSRQAMLEQVNHAITSRLRGFDFQGPIREALGELGISGKDGGGAGRQNSADEDDRVATLERAVQESQAELARERLGSSIRAHLSSRGVDPTLQHDAIRLIAEAKGWRSTPDGFGSHAWSGRTKVDGIEVEKPLADVVDGWLDSRPSYLPATHRGGTGAQGGAGGPGGSNGGPAKLSDMSAEDIEANPKLALELAKKAREAATKVSPFG